MQELEKLMNLRRILLDVDKGLNRPTLTELAGSIEEVPGVFDVENTMLVLVLPSGFSGYLDNRKNLV